MVCICDYRGFEPERDFSVKKTDMFLGEIKEEQNSSDVRFCDQSINKTRIPPSPPNQVEFTMGSEWFASVTIVDSNPRGISQSMIIVIMLAA